MRSVPELIVNKEFSTIAFDPMELGTMDASFDFAVSSFGDGDSYYWLAGGGERRYRVTRDGYTAAIDDGTSISRWIIEIEDAGQNLLHSFVCDGSDWNYFKDHEGRPVPYELVNMAMEMAIDIHEEEVELRRALPYRFIPGGGIIANFWYDPDYPN